MNKLKCYLIGSIQDEADGGVSWRDKLSKFLLENGIEVSDPTKDECNHSVAPTIEEQKKKLENWKRGGEWGSFKQTLRAIRKADLSNVITSDFLVVLYNPERRYGGTIHEVITAWEQSIPMFVVSYQPTMDANDWILSLFLENEDCGGARFKNFGQLKDHIEKRYKEYIKNYRDFCKLQAELESKKPLEESTTK